MEKIINEILDEVIEHKNKAVQVDNKVIKPNHYKAGEFDVIKYSTRAGKKENNSELQDLLKAREFLNRRIKYLRGE